MYKTKEIDHQKREDQEGSYSVYNYMYHYLLDNYEPEQLDSMASIQLESLERKLADIGKEYSIKGGNKVSKDRLIADARDAITNFINNDGQHGDTAHNFGKQHENSINAIVRTLKDLRW